MKSANPFDKKLDVWKHDIAAGVRDAVVFVTDTLDLSWAAAQAVFEDKATPVTQRRRCTKKKSKKD
ncbi:MAG: hypothetical protein ACREHG_04735 [Candidatus Saccharimonadales bacterium]